jgi:pimeloyl-ACP methyl ester carboxylesterase
VCATATVPLDYRAPRGRQISLAVVKHPAEDPARRIGTLFLNPGGPGGTGTSQIPAWIGFFPAALRDHFDIVSWDPRGIGESTAVQCFTTGDAEDRFLGDEATFPVGSAQQRTYIFKWAILGQRCAVRNGALLAHVSTAETAQDLDLLRRAVGDPMLNYIGLSYGTFLGATYANLFPDKVGALVLDGNLAPDNWTNANSPIAKLGISLRIGSDAGTSSVLASLLRLCGAVDTTKCAFSAGTPHATTAKFDTLLQRLLAAPIVIGSGPNAKTITYSLLLDELSDALDIVQALPNQDPALSIQGWSGAAAALQNLWEMSEQSDANSVVSTTAAAALAAGRSSAPASARYHGPEQGLSVICADAPNPRDPRDYARLEPFVLVRGGPVGLVALWNDEPCSTWPVRTPAAYRGPWNRSTANPILVVGNTNDPSTPYANSVLMTEQLARSRLLTLRGYGHTAVLNPSKCANDAMVSYLIDHVLPPAGTVCTQDEPPFAR